MGEMKKHLAETGLVPHHRDRNIQTALGAIIGFFAVWAIVLSLTERGVSVGTVELLGFIVVFAAPLGLLATIYGWSGVVDALLWTVRPPTPGPAAQEAVTFFHLGASFSLASGFVCTLLGLMVSLTNLNHPRDLGPSLAGTLVCQFVGILMATGCLLAAARVARRHVGVSVLAPLAQRSAGIAGATVIAGTLTTLVAFGILRLSVCPGL
jgi:hypothetical protein